MSRLGWLLAASAVFATPALAATVVNTNVTYGTGGGGAGTAVNPLDKVGQRKIVRDASGNTYLVFTRRSASTNLREVWIARGTGGTWSLKCLLGGSAGCLFGTASNQYLYPSIDINAARNEIHVALLHSTSTQVIYLKNRSLASWNFAFAWSTASGTTGSFDVPITGVYSTTAPAVAVDSGGNAHIAYLAPDGGGRKNVLYKRFDGSSWAASVNVSNQTNWSPAGGR